MIIERSARASPWRVPGVTSCSSDITIGCTLPRARPRNTAQAAIAQGDGASGYSRNTPPQPSMAPRTTAVALRRCASTGISRRTAVTAAVNVPRISPMVPAEKPRSCPSTGTAKVCTSQHMASRPFTSSRRRKPGSCSRSQAARSSRSSPCHEGCRGTRRAIASVISGSASSSA